MKQGLNAKYLSIVRAFHTGNRKLAELIYSNYRALGGKRTWFDVKLASNKTIIKSMKER